jgi:hypothetical protein
MKMYTKDKSEYLVAGIAAIILLEALTVALLIVARSDLSQTLRR